MALNLNIVSAVRTTDIDVINTGNLDIQRTIKSFWDEMTTLMKNYAELSFNPDPSKSLQIGNMMVSGDKVTDAATSLLIQDRLDQIQQAQTALLDIWDRMRKLEDRINSTSV